MILFVVVHSSATDPLRQERASRLRGEAPRAPAAGLDHPGGDGRQPRPPRRHGGPVTLENWKANRSSTAVNRSLRATFAGKTMIWSGLLIGAFLVYHLLQFTFRARPGLPLGDDALNRFNVFAMVYAAFQATPIAVVYVAGMVALFLHLSHGVQSVFQTMGWSNAFLLPRFETGGRTLSVILLVCFSAIPLSILFGLLGK
jgi:succinate dehydrogenase / fumarate reductase cytochrome b subunit